MSDEIGLLHHHVDQLKDDLIESLRGCLRIPSVEGPAAPNAPYGIECRRALNYTLELSNRLGFRTKDFDGHAGHAEIGEGEEMVAALGHLDVVPEGTGWTYPPYSAEIRNGKLFSRGASDDKGPTYAALFATKAILDSGLPLKRRIRVIFGCDEESGFGCVKHYWEVAKEERPVAGFTPDANFPLIYAEKGIANLTIERELGDSGSELQIVWATGGIRPNMVPQSASATLAGSDAALLKALGTLAVYWDKNIEYRLHEGQLIITSTGCSAHGSTPHKGDSAVTRLARALFELDIPNHLDWLEWLIQSTNTSGSGLGIAGRDDVAGPLTSNLGQFSIQNGKISALYNIRYPVTWKIDDLLSRATPFVEADGWKLAEHSDSPSLYVPLDQEPTKTLLRVYQEETGDTVSQPGTMGGGTYARATPHVVAYGMASADDTSAGGIHDADEFIDLEWFIKATKIYAHALYELAK